MWRVKLAICLGMLLCSAARADLNDFLGLPITTIKLSATAAADSFLVYNSSGLTPGEILTAAKIQDAIKKIYALGLFSDIDIFAEKSLRGVALSIQVKAYPRVSKIVIRGNGNIKSKTIKNKLSILEGRIVSPGAIKSNVQIIKDLYEDKGFLMADIQSELTPEPDDTSKAKLTFKIDEGRKVRVREISIVGNRHFTDDKIRSKMSTRVKSFLRSGTFDKEKFKEDKDKILDFYKNQGYIDAVITADSVIYSEFRQMHYSVTGGTTYVASPDLLIKLNIDEGQRYYFGDFTWDGNSVIGDDKIAGVFDVKEGEHYNQKKYDNMVFKIYEMYQNEGYLYARVDEKKSPSDNKLDVHFQITENQPVHVHMINIQGNTKTKEKVIRRELKIKPTEVFKRSVLGRSLRDIMILNFFANVTPDMDVLENGDIDLILKIEEKPTGQFQIGAGYSAQDKLVGTLGLGMPNFFGGGQTITLDAEFGKLRNTFSISYYEPWFRDTPTSVGLSVFYQERDWYDWFTEGRRGGSLRVGRRLRWPDNYFKIFSSYSLEEIKYFSISSGYKSDNVDNPYSVDKTNWPQRSSSLSLTLERDSRDLSQFATRGADVYWTGELGGTVLGGDWNYSKQVAAIDYYYTPFWKFTVSLKGKWGFLAGIYHGEDDVPYSERFTPGGTDPDGIIRGYEDSRIGPTTAAGGYLGGRSEVIYNLELTVPLAEQQFYILLFADAGNAYRTGDELRRNFYKNFYKSAGLGFRIVAPMIGIIGFDFGIPFNGPENDQGKIRPHFQIGRGF